MAESRGPGGESGMCGPPLKGGVMSVARLLILTVGPWVVTAKPTWVLTAGPHVATAALGLVCDDWGWQSFREFSHFTGLVKGSRKG